MGTKSHLSQCHRFSTLHLFHSPEAMPLKVNTENKKKRARNIRLIKRRCCAEQLWNEASLVTSPTEVLFTSDIHSFSEMLFSNASPLNAAVNQSNDGGNQAVWLSHFLRRRSTEKARKRQEN